MTITNPTGEQLQLAASLLHAAPRSRLVLGMETGRVLSIGSQPHDEATACQMRRSVTDPTEAESVASRVATMQFAGCFVGESGPVLHAHHVGRMEHWFVTPLCPFRLELLLPQIEFSIPHVHIEVRLIPDSAIGVTVGRVTVDHPVHRNSGADAALSVAARLEVEAMLDETLLLTGSEDDG